MNKGVLIGIIIAVIAVSVGIGFSLSGQNISEPQKVESETEREPKHYSVTIEENLGIKHP